jgi:DNA-binding transcriptional ArsR family regulator
MNNSMDLEMMQANALKAAALLKSLANPSRLMVLCALITREYTVSELEELTGLSQSALSQHLARLRDEDIVSSRRDAQRVFYRLSNPHVAAILETMHGIYCGVDALQPRSTDI